MGWTTYIYHKESGIAIDAMKFSKEDFDDKTIEQLFDYSNYCERDDCKVEVKDYLLNKICLNYFSKLMINLFLNTYSGWIVITEDEIKDLANVKVIER